MIQKTSHIFLFVWLCAIQSVWAEVGGPDKKYFLVKDFADEWLIYDQNQKNYVPYVAELHGGQLSANLLIDLESNRFYELMVYVEKDNYLFLDGSLQQRQTGGSWKVFKIDSLYRLYRKPQLLLTLYGSAGKTGKIVLIGHPKTATEKLITVQEESFLSLRPRTLSSLTNFFTLSLLLIVGFAALLYNVHSRAFQRFYNLYDLLATDVRDESFLVNKPFSRVNLLFLGLISLLLSYLFFFVQSKQYDLFSFKQFIAPNQTLGQSWFSFFSIASLFFGLLVAKYAALFVLGLLYQLDSVTKLHYFKILQSSAIFYAVAVIGLSFLSLYILDWTPIIKQVLIIPSIVFYLLRVVLLFFTISNAATAKNLYVISYLCIAELIPLIVGIRYTL